MDRTGKIFQVVCPHCHSSLWVDGESGSVVKIEKAAARQKESLEDLLQKEKKRQEGFARKFEATAEVEKQRQERAREKFTQALSRESEGEEDTGNG